MKIVRLVIATAVLLSMLVLSGGAGADAPIPTGFGTITFDHAHVTFDGYLSSSGHPECAAHREIFFSFRDGGWHLVGYLRSNDDGSFSIDSNGPTDKAYKAVAPSKEIGSEVCGQAKVFIAPL